MRGLTLVQIVVVIVILGFLAALVLPLLAYARESARRQQCRQQIRSLVTALYLYSDSPSNGGFFPTDAPTTADPFAASGGAASLGMLYRQFVSDPRIFSCPSSPVAVERRQMSVIRSWPADGSAPGPLDKMKPVQMSYAYDPGHGSSTHSYVVLIGDKAGANGNSDNHGRGKGQCVVFGTTAEFRSSVQSPLDDKGTRVDPDIFARNTELPRDEDSVLRP